MPQPHKRNPPRPPRQELIDLRKAKYPLLKTFEFAELLGVTRLHLNAVEQGRREPSLDLALRWLDVLAPQARIEMFGPLPVVEERIRTLKRLQAISPETFKAA
jgi:transcriptional regulator with XRE-family HTH domain